MGNKLIFVAVLCFCVLLLYFPIGYSFVISPSNIDVPVLTNGSVFSVDIVSDVQLDLLRTNCTIAYVTLRDNVLTISASSFSISNLEFCVISVYEKEKPSVSFDFEVILEIKSDLISNMTITYEETNLAVENKGTGYGKLFVQFATETVLCELNPGEMCNYEPNGLVTICSDVNCNNELFSHDFRNKNSHQSGGVTSEQSGRSRIWLWLAIGIFLLLLILTGLYYFTRRNNALLKDAS